MIYLYIQEVQGHATILETNKTHTILRPDD